MKDYYFLKRPGGGRKSFAIVKCLYKEGVRSYRTEYSDALSAINTSSMEVADKEAQANALVTALNRAEGEKHGVYVASEPNKKLLQKYFQEAYEFRKVNKKAAWDRLAQAVDVLGPTSLLAEAKDIQRWLNRCLSDDSRKQRRMASALNQVRAHLGCKDKVVPDAFVSPEFKYLTMKEFNQVLEKVEDEVYKLHLSVLFHTGARSGEVFALKPMHYRAPALNIVEQVLRSGKRGKTKGKKERKTICLPEGSSDLKKWLALSDAERNVIDRNSLANVWRAACVRAFPRDESKHTSAKDLRHSFAVYCLTEKNVSMSHIAKLLGNALEVCERYYLNFVFEDDTLQAIVAKF